MDINMISATNNPQSFGASWRQARKVITKLPKNHEFFQGITYTLDGNKPATKGELIRRLDAFAKVMKEHNWHASVNIAMPSFKTILKKPKKFFTACMERWRMSEGVEPYAETYDYPFKITVMKEDDESKILRTYKKDNVGSVSNYLIINGKLLSKEFEKAGLEDPKTLNF